MIPYNKRAEVYRSAIWLLGRDSRLWQAVEEMSELLKELAKIQRPGGTTMEKLIDELADVAVMVEQLVLMLGVREEVKERIDFKVRRLAVDTLHLPDPMPEEAQP